MITAIIPCYNAVPYLGQAIESVLAQSRRVDQVIVVDDCSTDGSVALARSYPGVEVLSTPRNSGHAAARNVAIEAARGNLLAWLDADDYWNPDHSEVVCGLLDRYPEAGVACSAVQRFGNETTIWNPAIFGDVPFDAFWESFARVIVPAMSAVSRTEITRRVGGFDATTRVAPDFEFWLRMSRATRFVSTSRVTSNYRSHGGQITRTASHKQVESVYRGRHKHLEEARAGGDREWERQLTSHALALWDNDLEQLWYLGRHNQLRMFLMFRKYLPCDTPTSRRLARSLARRERFKAVADMVKRQPLLDWSARRLVRGLRRGRDAIRKLRPAPSEERPTRVTLIEGTAYPPPPADDLAARGGASR